MPNHSSDWPVSDYHQRVATEEAYTRIPDHYSDGRVSKQYQHVATDAYTRIPNQYSDWSLSTNHQDIETEYAYQTCHSSAYDYDQLSVSTRKGHYQCQTGKSNR